MKYQFLWIFLVLILYEFTCTSVCTCENSFDMSGSDTLFFSEPNRIVCITAPVTTLYGLSTYHGFFNVDSGINDIKCSVDGQLLKFKFESVYKFIIVKDSANTKTGMIVSKSHYTELAERKTYVYKAHYHQFDMECFHKDETDIATKETDFLQQLGGKKFQGSPDTLYCFWFDDNKIGFITLTVNGSGNLKINKGSRSGQSSSLSKAIPSCKETGLPVDTSLEKNVNTLNANQNEFCVPSSTNSLEKIKRTHSTDVNQQINNYCKYEILDKFCLKVGTDFEYAIFVRESSTPTRIIIISHRTYEASIFSQAELGQNLDIPITLIKCGSMLTYREKFAKFMGILDTSQNIHCLIASEFRSDSTFTHTHSTGQKTKKFIGCTISSPGVMKTQKLIKLEVNSEVVCLPHGNTMIKHIHAPGFTFKNHVIHEDKVCSVEFTTSVCYRVESQVNYVVILNPNTQSLTLIYRIAHKINENVLNEFLYAPTLYKNEVVFVKKQNLNDFEVIKDKSYVFVHGDKVIFLVVGMDVNDKINLKNVVSCANRQLNVDPTIDRTVTHENSVKVCDPFYKDHTNPNKVKALSSEMMNTCLRITCTKRIYSFSIKQINDNYGVDSITECENGAGACIITDDAKKVIYRVQKNQANQRIFVAVEEHAITLSDESLLLYETDYYKYDIVCLRKDNIQGEKGQTVFQLEIGEYLCSIGREINQNEIIISYKSSHNCMISIILHGFSINPTPNQPLLKTSCSYVISKSATVFLRVDPKLLSLCLTRTCTKITNIINLSSRDESVSYTYSACETTDSAQKTCLDQAIAGSIMKIKSPRFSPNQIVYTKELIGDIPTNHFYSTYYGPNVMICFKTSRVTNFNNVKSNSVFGEQSTRMCAITNQVTTPFTIEYSVDRSCTISINLESSENNALRTTSTNLNSQCEIFTESRTDSLLIIENIDKMDECRTKMCLKADYVVTTTDSITDCKSASCTIDNNANMIYYKIISIYNNRNIYIIPKTEVKAQIVDSYKTGYYQSIFFASDIVCYKSDKLEAKDKLPSPAYFLIQPLKSCFILKELPQSKNIDVSIYDGCKRKISLLNTIKPTGGYHHHPNDVLCTLFTQSSALNSVIKMSLTTLKTCVKHFCLKPLFIVKSQGSDSDHVATKIDCDANSYQCVADAISFDFVKLQNSYTDETFYVQNSVERTLNIPEKYFYPSPYHESEVLCILRSKIVEPDEATFSNSYSLGNHKCLILKELGKTKLAITSETPCQREIDISSASQVGVTSRTVDEQICKDFLIQVVPQSTVASISHPNFANCLLHTCSTVKSAVELTTNVPLVHMKPGACDRTKGDSSCLENLKIYDFIKVESETFQKHRYFRILGGVAISTHVPTSFEFYSTVYNNDDLVCFQQASFIGPTNWESLAGVFKESTRVCVISNDLVTGIDVEYKLSDTYNQRIRFTNSNGEVLISHGQQIKTDCSEFFSPVTDTTKYYEYEKSKLLNCVKNTYSLVNFLVKLEANNEDIIVKKINLCNKHTDVESCFTDITHYDAVKIKSPFRMNPFYVRSSGITKPDVTTYKSHSYKDTYHSDEFVCVHDTLRKEPSSLNPMPSGFLNMVGVTCVIVRDTTDILSMTVHQFEKCDKMVNFARFTVENREDSRDPCNAFHSGSQDGHTVQMSLVTLKNCLKSSCSKLLYYTSDSESNEKLIKKTHDCDTPTHGSISCLDGVTKYHLAKVQLGFDNEKYAYVEEDNNDSIKTEEYDSFFYASKYFKNEVICTRTDMIHRKSSTLAKVKKGNKQQVCFIVKELSAQPSLELSMKNGCTKQMEIDLTNERAEDQTSNDYKCKMFYSGGSVDNNMHVLDKAELTNCVRFTCSKITSLIPIDSSITHYTSAKVTHCTKPYGDSSCIESTDYDFLKIKNAYNSVPLYFRSKNYDSSHHEETPIKFYSSIYYHDDIICYSLSLIINLKQIEILPGVYNTAQRTCILGSEVKKDILIQVKVGDKCKRNIYVTNKPSTGSVHPSHLNDEKCSIYYKGDNNLVVQSNQIMLECVAHTCSTLEYVNQSISEVNCKDDKSSCQKSKNIFTYGKVTSPYKTNPILVMTEDTKTKWISQIENIEKYKINYSLDHIICFKNDMISKPIDPPKTYVNKELNIICMQSQSKDEEFILTITGMVPMKLKLIKKNDAIITKISEKQYTLTINGIRSFSGSVTEVFKFESKLDKNTLLTDSSELESCAKENEKEKTQEDFEKLDKPDAYAFTIKSNIVFSHPIAFLLTQHSACGKHFNQDQQPPAILELTESNKALHQLECVLVSNDYFTINIISKTFDEFMNTEQSCLDEDQLKKNCDFVHQYSTNIFICYISRKVEKSEDDFKDDDEEEASQSPVYVMIKKDHCYIPKIMKHQRVAMCKIDENGLKINVIDFEMFGKTEGKSTSESSKIQQSSWSFLGLIVLSLLVLMFLFSTRKKSKSPPVEKSV